MVASIESSVDGLDSVSVGASWTPDRNGSQEVSVVVDPVGVVGELDEGNNMASKEVYVLCRVPIWHDHCAGRLFYVVCA